MSTFSPSFSNWTRAEPQRHSCKSSCWCATICQTLACTGWTRAAAAAAFASSPGRFKGQQLYKEKSEETAVQVSQHDRLRTLSTKQFRLHNLCNTVILSSLSGSEGMNRCWPQMRSRPALSSADCLIQKILSFLQLLIDPDTTMKWRSRERAIF